MFKAELKELEIRLHIRLYENGLDLNKNLIRINQDYKNRYEAPIFGSVTGAMLGYIVGNKPFSNKWPFI